MSSHLHWIPAVASAASDTAAVFGIAVDVVAVAAAADNKQPCKDDGVAGTSSAAAASSLWPPPGTAWLPSIADTECAGPTAAGRKEAGVAVAAVAMRSDQSHWFAASCYLITTTNNSNKEQPLHN